MSKVDWFLEHQDEAKAYRVTKIKIPRLGYTLYRDSLNMGKPVRNIHMCSDELFHGDLEDVRIRDPFIGLDVMLILGELTFDKVLMHIEKLRRMEIKPIKLTIDMSVGAACYTQYEFLEGVVGIIEVCRYLRDMKVSFTTCQYHPMEMDVKATIAKMNEAIFRCNKQNGVYTPYLHRSTMRAKKGRMCYRYGLWERDDGIGPNLKLNRDGYILYLRYMKKFHELGFEMDVNGVCNPVTLVKSIDQVIISDVECGTMVQRTRPERVLTDFKVAVTSYGDREEEVQDEE